MKKLLRGFTLAEVLIALAVIGVVASITLPNLSVNVTKRQAGPSFAKAINTLESANELALEEGRARTLDELCGENKLDYLNTVLSPYVKWTKTTLTKTYTYKNEADSFADTSTEAFVAKDGITYWMVTADAYANQPLDSGNANLSRMYSGKYFVVAIDINGNNKGPNDRGKDMFVVMVDTKGTVIPMGGLAHKEYSNLTSVPWETGCNTGKVTEPNACGGSIADHGYSVVY